MLNAFNYVLFNCNPDPPRVGGVPVGGGWNGRTGRFYDIADVNIVSGDDGAGWDTTVHREDGVIDIGTLAFIFRAGKSEGKPHGHIAGVVFVQGRVRQEIEPTGVVEWYAPGTIWCWPRRCWIDVEAHLQDPTRPMRAPFRGGPGGRPLVVFHSGEELTDDEAAWLIGHLHPDLPPALNTLSESVWGNLDEIAAEVEAEEGEGA